MSCSMRCRLRPRVALAAESGSPWLLVLGSGGEIWTKWESCAVAYSI